MVSPFFLALATLSGAAALAWWRAFALRLGVLRRAENEVTDSGQLALARYDVASDLHAALLYTAITLFAAWASRSESRHPEYLLVALAGPAMLGVWINRSVRQRTRSAISRLALHQRAHEVLHQGEDAPRRWAARLTPDELVDVAGFEVGSEHQAGEGMMGGDFLDYFQLPSGHLVAAIGDVTGHGVEASITAFQVKYLLRSFLRRYRDPGQALEELNAQLGDLERPDDFISLVVAVIDPSANTLRYASAGHPAAWLRVEKSVRPLRSTGPLLVLDPEATYSSRELEFMVGDTLLLFTDGLSEARAGDNFFGEERIAAALRRDPDVSAPVLCKTLVDAAVDFASGRISDDVTVLAVRRAA